MGDGELGIRDWGWGLGMRFENKDWGLETGIGNKMEGIED